MTSEVTNTDEQYVAYARQVTDQIKTATEEVVKLLHQAQDEELWRHLGYSSWKAYIDPEFEFSTRRSYQLLRYDRVLKALGDGTKVQSSDRFHRQRPEPDIAGGHRCTPATSACKQMASGRLLWRGSEPIPRNECR